MNDNSVGDFINEKCPKCGATLLGNKNGDKWCSLVGCDYGLNSDTKRNYQQEFEKETGLKTHFHELVDGQKKKIWYDYRYVEWLESKLAERDKEITELKNGVNIKIGNIG